MSGNFIDLTTRQHASRQMVAEALISTRVRPEADLLGAVEEYGARKMADKVLLELFWARVLWPVPL